jgi:hypothetical protein
MSEPDIGSHRGRMVRKGRLRNEPASTANSVADGRFMRVQQLQHRRDRFDALSVEPAPYPGEPLAKLRRA